MFQDQYRQRGRTTRALARCPKEAIYVVATYREVEYTHRLALHLGRPDIAIVAIRYIQARNHRGLRRRIILDHHVGENRSTWLSFLEFRELVQEIALHNDKIGKESKQ